MTIKEYCESCKNKGSHKCHSCMGRYYDGVLQGKPTKYIKMQQTNADHIRAMSDDELAMFLAENEWECETYNDCAKCPRMTDDGCVSLLKWLKHTVEVEDGQA